MFRTGVELEDRLPPNEYLEYYGPDFRLQPVVPKDKPNTNSPEYLEEVINPCTRCCSCCCWRSRVAAIPYVMCCWRSRVAAILYVNYMADGH